jgi:PAS domain S-box-containing protein
MIAAPLSFRWRQCEILAMEHRPDLFRAMIDNIPTLAWCCGPDGAAEFVNQRWLDYTGLSMDEALGWGWKVSIHPDDTGKLMDTWVRLLRSEELGEVEARMRRVDGVYRWFQFRAAPVRNERGKIDRWYGTNTDIEDLKRAELLVYAEKRSLEMIAGGANLADILASLCTLIDAQAPGAVSSIFLMDRDGKQLWPAAGGRLPSDYIKAISPIQIGPNMRSCGTAAFLKRRVIVSEIACDPLWADYRDLALKHGIRAAWSQPIVSERNEVLGTFGLHYSKTQSPDGGDLRLIEGAGRIALIAIEHSRTQEELRRSEAYLADAQRLSHTGSLGWKVSTGELYWSDETYRIYQVDRKIKPTVELVMTMIHPEDLSRVQKTCACAAQDGKDYTHKYRIVMPDGSLKSLHIEAHSTKDISGNFEYVGAVMDVTERKKAEETLQASEHLARGQLNALTHTLDALASDSQPDKFLEHVLRTISVQFDAHGTSIWRRLPTGLICFEAAIESGKLITKSTPEIAAISLPLPIEHIWPYPEQLRAATPSVMEDIMEAPNSQWRDRLQRQGVVTILLAPMMIAGQVEGAIGIRFTQKRSFRNDEIELARALAHQALLAMQLTKLSMQSRQTAVLAERNRLARDMHDLLAQGFTGVIVQLEAAEDANSRRLPKAAAEHIGRAAEMARYGLREARRSVQALRPLALNGTHVCAAMQELLRDTTAGTELQTTFKLHGIPRQLPAVWEDHLLRVEQEALTNTFRHAGADHFSVAMFFDPAGIRLELCDDGSGFDATTEHEGFGLLGIKERVEEMGGTLTIASVRGEGTQISVHVPLPSQGDYRINFDE